ncbi:hypothetical protein K432DRAFT_60130 [Lepidopterella palustris CBS 459.81]|uniref:Uncharacterized protein n=1 Tax=Lepidopterella palustris CBS 459.81 TaxID=1314670 RepID=A0A8E2E925_9PEZI|nr:hypothetical protein K432DRAFT_60130 [Lepidopterella palustris CBS 459.81]
MIITGDEAAPLESPRPRSSQAPPSSMARSQGREKTPSRRSSGIPKYPSSQSDDEYVRPGAGLEVTRPLASPRSLALSRHGPTTEPPSPGCAASSKTTRPW